VTAVLHLIGNILIIMVMANTTVIIPAGGHQTRWEHSGNKHLINIFGEPLIVRICRQALTLADVVVVLTANNKVAETVSRISGVEVSDKIADSLCGSIMNGWRFWGNKTFILLGDVYFTDDAIARISTFSDIQPYFDFYGTEHEVFAMAFGRLARIRIGLQEVILKHAIDVGDGKMWGLYRALHNLNITAHERGESGNFTYIKDGTRDFDYYHEYENFLEEQRKESG